MSTESITKQWEASPEAINKILVDMDKKHLSKNTSDKMTYEDFVNQLINKRILDEENLRLELLDENISLAQRSRDLFWSNHCSYCPFANKCIEDGRIKSASGARCLNMMKTFIEDFDDGEIALKDIEVIDDYIDIYYE